MILIDSSVWVDYFGRRALLADQIDAFLDTRNTIATTGIIEQEILQGLRDAETAREIKKIFGAMIYYPIERPLYHAAAATYRLLRRQGITIRSSIDCLLAEFCIDRNLPIWHKDRDFNLIARVRPLVVFEP